MADAEPKKPVILRLTEHVSDVRYDDVRETIRYVGESLEPGGRYEQEGFTPTSCVVIMVDDRGNMYNIKVRPSALKRSEIVAMLAIAQAQEVRSMFVPE